MQTGTVTLARGSSWRGLLRSLRPGQWIKNSVIFAALIFARRFLDPVAVGRTAYAFLLPNGRGVGHCKPRNRIVGNVPYPFRHLCRMTPDLDARWMQHGIRLYGKRRWPGPWPPPTMAPWNAETTTRGWEKLIREERLCQRKASNLAPSS